MFKRVLEKKLRETAKLYPVVTLTGPRQSGKTTLALAAFPGHEYVSLEDPEQRGVAREDPRGFLARFRKRVIIDEVQRVPDLFSYVQTNVDTDDRPGRYVLTGSQNFLLMRSVSQSLAGRCAVLHLLPLSLDELHGWKPRRMADLSATPAHARREPGRGMWDTLMAGFYPRIHARRLPAQDWLGNYYQTYLERDVRELVNVGDLEAFRRFVALVAGRSGQLLNLSSLGTDCGISQPTARRWLSILETSFLVHLLPPHHVSFRKRLVKAPKLHFLDTGLLCYLLRIRSAEQLQQHSARGAVFESFVVSELLKKRVHRGEAPDLYFWRDSNGHEVDALVEHGDGQTPVEMKSGMTVAPDMFRGLDYWRGLAGRADGPAVLFYGGPRSFHHRGIAVRTWWEV